MFYGNNKERVKEETFASELLEDICIQYQILSDGFNKFKYYLDYILLLISKELI